ncbi:MAG: glycosyltransferase family 4 protein [Thermodesulfobacteriota bacterium]|nr:glycosyltransferase family 4 protein [Thermodesulfobacteriota bacterium]
MIALSHEWRKKLLTIQRTCRVQVIENGINLDQFPTKKVNPHPTLSNQILFLGRIGQRKGIYDIIEAATLLLPAKYKFTLAGDGEIHQVKKLVLHRKLQDIIDVPGWVDHKRKATLLRQADLFLLPSYHEGLPISILEAMASYLPVIATPVGGIPQLVKHNENGYLVPPGDHKALANAIEKIFSDPERWARFSRRSRQIVQQNFSMARVKNDLSRLYEGLTEK